MSSNRSLTNEQYTDLFEYANRVLKETPKCSTIMRWVREHHYNLENFFLAYTLVKYGKCDEKSYMATRKEFKEKHITELMKDYGEETRYGYFPGLFGKNSPLYQACFEAMQRDQKSENVESSKIKPN